MFNKYFQKIVSKYNTKIAIKKNDIEITYQDLDTRTNIISKNIFTKLRDLNNKSVILFYEHGIDVVLAIVSSLRIGVTYVPIDVNYPQRRIHFICINFIKCNNIRFLFAMFFINS